MQSKFLKSLVLAVTLLATVAGFQSARAQANADAKEKPAVYTYVAEWSVPRLSWSTMEGPNAPQKQLLEKLLADGTIIDFGSFKVLSHQEGGSTHGNWWTANSMANLLKALAVVSAQTAASDTNKILAESKHFDLILTSKQYGSHSGTFDNGYLRVATYRAKPGQGEAMQKAIDAYIIPILDKLLADGAIHLYSVDREAIHTDDPGSVDIAIVTNGAEGLDKFMAALDAAGKSNPLGGPAFGAATDSSAHRDMLATATVTIK
jgi:hypothetical protein